MKKYLAILIISLFLFLPVVNANMMEYKWSIDLNTITNKQIDTSRTPPIAYNVDTDPQKEVFFTFGSYDQVADVWGGIICVDGETGIEEWHLIHNDLDCHTFFQVSNIDKTGDPELIISGRGIILCLNARTGTPIWEHKTTTRADRGLIILEEDNEVFIFIAGNYDDGMMKFDTDGNLLKSNTYPEFTCNGGLAAADLDGDGSIELVRPGRNKGYGGNDNYKGLQCYNTDLVLQWEHPEILCSGQFPVIINADDDSELEVIAGSTGGDIYVIDSDGTILKSKLNVATSHDAPSIYDIDGDGGLEIVLAKQGRSTIDIVDLDTLTVQQTITIDPSPTTDFAPLIVNVQGDSTPEILLSQFKWGVGLTVYDLDFNELWYSGETDPNNNYFNPYWFSVFDIDGDAYNELVSYGYDEAHGASHVVFAYDTEGAVYSPQRTNIPHYGERRTGVAGYTAPLIGDSIPEEPVTCWKCEEDYKESKEFPPETLCGLGDASNYPWSNPDDCELMPPPDWCYECVDGEIKYTTHPSGTDCKSLGLLPVDGTESCFSVPGFELSLLLIGLMFYFGRKHR